MRARPTSLLLLAAVLAGCGGDPSEPRDVRDIDRERLDGAPKVERDETTPTGGLPCEEQRRVRTKLCGAATDNYKASYNDDPEAGERRTWLAIHRLEFGGERYALVDGQALTSPSLRLRSIDGSDVLTVNAELRDGPADTITMRAGPQHELWGPLLTLEERPVPEDEPVVVVLQLERDGEQVGSVDVEYRRDAALAQAGDDSLEHRGPGGRWYVAGTPTATNVELGWE